MVKVTPRQRVVALILYTIVLMVVHYLVIEPNFLPSKKVLWFYNGIASLLFGTRLLNPHFTPPADAATNGFWVVLAMLAASLAVAPWTVDIAVVGGIGLFGALVLGASLLVILVRRPAGPETRLWLVGLDETVRRLGSPNVIYTAVILGAVWLFHRERPEEVLAILATWTVIVTLGPVEGTQRLVGTLRGLVTEEWPDRVIGVIAAHQSPGIVLIRQTGGTNVDRGTPLLITDDHGQQALAVALNYVGRDEGNLLRSLSFPVPAELRPRVEASAGSVGAGVATRVELTDEDRDGIPDSHPASILKRTGQLCGIVDEGTTLDFLQFEVVEDRELAEGRLVEASIASNPVLFQVIEGVTREDMVQQKNKYGYARARARKIGRWNAKSGKFEPAKWLPRMNAPVLLREIDEPVATEDVVGHFPGTSYTVALDISEAVTHNTAILGILGIGKSYLAMELVERMIAANIKVICLDLTDQYEQELDVFLDAEHERPMLDELQQIGRRGLTAYHQSQERGGSVNQFKAKLVEQLQDFLGPGGQRYLRIYNPNKFEAYRQSGFLDRNTRTAPMSLLTPTEIAALASEAALQVCQEMGMTNDARVCIVFEEAHMVVPERTSVAARVDELSTARTARAILQGRKFGLGCLLITQRTANVTKTILNQCNTIFAMRIFDDTGKEFLSNYIGGDYATVLPSLETRHAVVFGKASSCDNPVLVQLNDRSDFLDAFRQTNPPRPLPQRAMAEAPEELAEIPPDLDDEVPF